MIVKAIIDEDFVNYKKPSMFIAFPRCDFKCEKECGIACCQNSDLAQSPDIEIDCQNLVNRFLKNPISEAVVCGGLETFDTFDDLISFIRAFREKSDAEIVVFTGFSRGEVDDKIQVLSSFKNIIVKFGRYIPGQKPHYDEVLGIELASDNQYAERIS